MEQKDEKDNKERGHSMSILESYTHSDLEVIVPELIAENRRLREALGQIAEYTDDSKAMLHMIAKEALEIEATA